MSELIVVAFKGDKERAAAVLNELRANDEPWTAHLHHAIAVYRNAHGALEVDEAFESTRGQQAIVGGLLGSLAGLALATLALPLTGGASAPVIGGALLAGAIGGTVVGSRHGAADASWWKDELGVPDEFVQRVRAEVGSCDSAIAVLLQHAEPGLAERFQRYGGTLLRTPLTPDQLVKVRIRFET